MLAKVRVEMLGKWIEIPLTPSLIQCGIRYVIGKSFEGKMCDVIEAMEEVTRESCVGRIELMPGTYIVGNGLAGAYAIRDIVDEDKPNLVGLKDFLIGIDDIPDPMKDEDEY
jgi:hypothetical protein